MEYNKTSEELEKLYSLGIWPEDPYTDVGMQRFRQALGHMARLVEHEYVQRLLQSRKSVRILDLCAGTGVGGVALAKTLMDQGYSVELHLADLRKSALETGKRFSRDILGVEARVHVVDAREAYRLQGGFDIVLVYGWSAPHFSPWDMARVLASAAEITSDDGVIALEEIDRRLTVFLSKGYRYVLPAAVGEDRVVLDVHAGYDPATGMIKRVTVDLLSGRSVANGFYYWSIAELATLVWLLFRDVDLLELQGLRRVFILGQGPRRALRAQDLAQPRLLVRRPS
ncbi:hypothetical protein Pyrde_0246 [Pyrodictium delaneyi]|uniref:Methyltransferase domain-containing protein n=1 Tax=Pyrodictium delaneyi TaxID=1273541 RepID=A0A0P0N2L0_9CREN|nr:class I SAM-dependent methyltransferase [Pyrodictium delaneyi]ALL00296.1 hypothetical protein Pyrde_0246 [Pyrodictium delaneyi]OWJ54366.1 hypothetical protein Pdsh_07785 [Pyrodictium delaneyi]